MNYKEILSYLFKQLPMYQREGKAAYKADLSNTHLLCDILNHPERNFKSVHIAGTNGKGSTSHMLASIMQEAGYKVGLYTSPHLKDFRERVKINGEMISEEDVISFVEQYKSKFEKINLSFFEWTVGLAFDYFSKNEVDIAIIETGLGGRLDSTNVVFPEVAVITNVGKDHTQFLGETLIEIAGEKAGIIKRETPVIIGETQDEIEHVFKQRAIDRSASICFADKEDHIKRDTDLKGNYQQKNVHTCLVAINQLKNKGWKIPEESIKKGLLNVVKNTGLLGRWQVLQNSPLVICDTGHNETGIIEITKQFKEIDFDNLHIVIGFVNDKAIGKILQYLPKNATYYYCEAKIERALNVMELKDLATKNGLKGSVYNSVDDALKNAKNDALKTDLIFVGGSTFVVAEVL